MKKLVLTIGFALLVCSALVNLAAIPFTVAGDADPVALEKAAQFASVYQFVGVFISAATLVAVFWQLLGAKQAQEDSLQQMASVSQELSQISRSISDLTDSLQRIADTAETQVSQRALDSNHESPNDALASMRTDRYAA